MKKKTYWEKSFIMKNFFTEKKLFFTEEDINENVKNIYIIPKIYFYTENVKFFLNIYSFCKKNFHPKKYLLRLRWELNTLVLKVLEEANQWYS